MNKRPIIFVVVLTLALFVLNQYFGSQEEKKRTAYLEEKRKKEIEELQRTATGDEQQRTASLSSLPLVKLYEDKESTKLATLAIAQDRQYLTTAWSSSVPKTLFLPKNGETLSVELRVSPKNAGDAILYSADKQASLHTALPPDSGKYDVQVVTFMNDNKEAKTTLGIVEDGRFIGPVQPLDNTGIILYQSNSGYLPWGIYNPKTYTFSALPAISPFSSVAYQEIPKGQISDIHANEQFYVLENGYQQLVFSNLGGALAEINLPLHSEQNPNSVVLPIDFDRTMEKEYQANDYFPLFPYRTPEGSHQQGVYGGYYPLIRRAIMASGNHVAVPVSPQYYALNLVNDDPEFANIVYSVKRFEKNLIEFEGNWKGATITKTFMLPKDPDLAAYSIELYVTVEGNPGKLKLTSGVPEVELISDSFTPNLKYRTVKQAKGKVTSLDLPKENFLSDSILPDWVSNSNGFFGIILDPLPKEAPGLAASYVPGEVLPSRITLIDAKYELYPAKKYPGYSFYLPLDSKKKTSHYMVFAGPYQKDILERIDSAYYTQAEGSPDFEAAQSVQGWFSFISEPFAKFLFLLMRFFYFATHSWGLSIILLTIALRIMLYPLNAWSIRSTLRMQEIAPHVQALQARYKKDPKRAQMEIMHLYREKGVNPLSGCFPLLIQLPFLIGMFDLLKTTFALRGASFIPGWIDDLAAPDVLFSWNYPIFFIGHQFHLLPFLLGAVMYIQQRFSASATLTANQPMTDQQRQQKFMGNIMVVVFTVMFYNFPSGLNIYWLSSMLLGILQQWWMTKKMKKSSVVEVIKN